MYLADFTSINKWIREGLMTDSDPPYEKGRRWVAQIRSNSINGYGDYLFYEAFVPDSGFRKGAGWLVKSRSLKEDIERCAGKTAKNRMPQKRDCRMGRSVPPRVRRGLGYQGRSKLGSVPHSAVPAGRNACVFFKQPAEILKRRKTAGVRHLLDGDRCVPFAQHAFCQFKP